MSIATRLHTWCVSEAHQFGCGIAQEITTRHLILMSEPETFQTPLEQGMFAHLQKQLALHNQYEDQGFDSDSQTYRDGEKDAYGRYVISWQDLW